MTLALTLLALRLTAAQDLAAANAPLAFWLARHYARNTGELPDLESAALRGLVEASLRYDPDRGSFATFARAYIVGHLKTYIRLAIARRRREAGTRSLSDWHSVAENVIDPGKAPDAALEASDWWGHVLSALPPGQAAAVKLVYRDGLSGPEAAEVLGTSPGAVSLRLTEARRKLREHLKEVA